MVVWAYTLVVSCWLGDMVEQDWELLGVLPTQDGSTVVSDQITEFEMSVKLIHISNAVRITKCKHDLKIYLYMIFFKKHVDKR